MLTGAAPGEAIWTYRYLPTPNVFDTVIVSLRWPELLPDVAHGVEYVNGVRAVNRRDEKVAA